MVRSWQEATILMRSWQEAIILVRRSPPPRSNTPLKRHPPQSNTPPPLSDTPLVCTTHSAIGSPLYSR